MSVKISSELAILFLLLAAISFSFSLYYGFRIYALVSPRFRSNSVRILVSILILISLFFAIFYITDKSETCIPCHSVNTLSKPHKKLECITCHAENSLSGKLVFKLQQAKMFLSFERYRLGSSFECVPNSRCLKCHEEIKKTIKSQKLRVRHFDFIQTTKCIGCHENSVHAVFNTQTNAMDKCLSCHIPKVLENGCKPCHLNKLSFSEYKKELGIEHTSNFYKTHGFSVSNTCIPCHHVEFCNKCHSSYPHKNGFKQVHGKLAKNDVSECRKCHLTVKCNNCHGIEMPHNEYWKELHGKQAVKNWAQICSRCHSLYSCSNCHHKNFIDRFKEKLEQNERI